MTRTTMTLVALMVPGMLAAQQTQRDTNRTRADTGRVNAQQNAQQADSAARHGGVHDTAVVRTGRTVVPSPQDTTTHPQRVGFERDTAGAAQQGQQQGQTMGQRSGRNVRAGLTREQLVQLQQTLTAIGCDVGTADGRPSPKMREALSCAQQKLAATKSTTTGQQGMTGQDTSGVTSTGAFQTDPARQAVQGDSNVVGGRNQGRVRPPEDTTGRVGGTPLSDTTATNRARQQGMTDSTVMRPDSSALQGTTPGRRVNQMNESGDTTSSALRDSLVKANTQAKPATRDTTRRTPPQL
jgi:hypothetical protein